jgi:hypothetical protein
MRFCIAALLLSLPGLARAGEGAPGSPAEEMLKILKETKSLLASIKDAKTAEAARPKLRALSKRLAKLKEVQAALAEVARELDRIAGLPGAAQALRDVPLLDSAAQAEQARRKRAKIAVHSLEVAVEAYAARNGAHPPDLKTLTVVDPNTGARAALEAKHLIDPWGRPYVYEPTTVHPTSGRPLIYSQGPHPKDPASRIANWTAPAKKK